METELAIENGLQPFEVLVIEPSRTICEKIMSLVRFSYGENAIEDLKKKIRHLYDIHKLLLRKEFADFFNSKEFEEMLLKVANDDVVSYKNDNAWLVYHPSKALIFNDPDKIWKELKRAYTDDFRILVYGELPDERDLYLTLNKLKNRLVTMEWNVALT